MSAEANTILSHLQSVAAERARRDSDRRLGSRVTAIKTYQQRRFAKTYADMIASPRYGPAATFFLEKLYGPRDFADRDAQFARVVPALVRLFPQEIVATVATLAELHALSETLDTTAASHLDSDEIDALGYVRVWQATGRREDRARQISLTLTVGESLDQLTRSPLVRHTLRMMRGPARAAGLGELQTFLESGFDAFKAMKGAREFLDTIGSRERLLLQTLFDVSLPPDGRLGDIALGQLP